MSEVGSDGAAEYRYTLFGLTFGSDVALALPFGSPSAKLMFSLRAASHEEPYARTDDALPDDGDQWARSRLLPSGEYEVELKDWLRIRASHDGRSISYRIHDTVDREAFEAHIANFAASIALLLQGEETIHSTVVWTHGRGVGLVGPSGAGKSTFAAHMLTHGAELVTDDLLRITETENRLFAEAGPPRLKLFAHTADRHFANQWPRGKWNPLSEKYLFATAGGREAGLRRPLDALVFLAHPAATEPHKVSIVRLAGLELFRAISGSTMVSSFNRADRLTRQFEFIQWIARSIPVFSLSYPRQDDIFPELSLLLQETLS